MEKTEGKQGWAEGELLWELPQSLANHAGNACPLESPPLGGKGQIYLPHSGRLDVLAWEGQGLQLRPTLKALTAEHCLFAALRKQDFLLQPSWWTSVSTDCYSGYSEPLLHSLSLAASPRFL